jgi:hypothetical protein
MPHAGDEDRRREGIGGGPRQFRTRSIAICLRLVLKTLFLFCARANPKCMPIRMPDVTLPQSPFLVRRRPRHGDSVF